MKSSSAFRMPTPIKITGRSSSITNAFINSIIPVVQPTSDEIEKALKILGMTPAKCECIYCGNAVSEWDHLRPLVEQQKPTGYISEIHNLVPSCGKCNQSKGNRNWREWMTSSAELSPTTRRIRDIEDRIQRLEAYERWLVPTKIDFESVVGKDIWAQHWQNWERVQSLMRESQGLAAHINEKVTCAFKAGNTQAG